MRSEEQLRRDVFGIINSFQDIFSWQEGESRNGLVCEIRDKVDACFERNEREREQGEENPVMTCLSCQATTDKVEPYPACGQCGAMLIAPTQRTPSPTEAPREDFPVPAKKPSKLVHCCPACANTHVCPDECALGSRQMSQPQSDTCPECKHPWDRHDPVAGKCCARDVDASGNYDRCGCTRRPPACENPRAGDVIAQALDAWNGYPKPPGTYDYITRKYMTAAAQVILRALQNEMLNHASGYTAHEKECAIAIHDKAARNLGLEVRE